jgi:hypothetical protein
MLEREYCVLNVFLIIKCQIVIELKLEGLTVVYLVFAGVLGGPHPGRCGGRRSVQVLVPGQERGGRDKLV